MCIRDRGIVTGLKGEGFLFLLKIINLFPTCVASPMLKKSFVKGTMMCSCGIGMQGVTRERNTILRNPVLCDAHKRTNISGAHRRRQQSWDKPNNMVKLWILFATCSEAGGNIIRDHAHLCDVHRGTVISSTVNTHEQQRTLSTVTNFYR